MSRTFRLPGVVPIVTLVEQARALADGSQAIDEQTLALFALLVTDIGHQLIETGGVSALQTASRCSAASSRNLDEGIVV